MADIREDMDNDLTRLLGWTATLQDFSVAALVTSFVFLGTQAPASEHLHFEDHLPVAAISRDLRVVGIPTIMDISDAQVVSGSAAILPGASHSEVPQLPVVCPSSTPVRATRPRRPSGLQKACRASAARRQTSS